MNVKKYVRKEPDGIHWPDADIGDNLYYGIDFNDYLNSITDTENLPSLQAEEITSVTWDIPTGVSSEDEYIEGNVVVVKLKTEQLGVFKITCNLNTVSSAKNQLQVIPMILTVY